VQPVHCCGQNWLPVLIAAAKDFVGKREDGSMNASFDVFAMAVLAKGRMVMAAEEEARPYERLPCRGVRVAVEIDANSKVQKCCSSYWH